MTRKDRGSSRTGSPRRDSASRDGTPGVSYTGRGVHRIVVEALARRIFDGTYAEGDLLDLPGLMAELDVSQTVLREAIKVLTTKGLLDARQKRGTFIRPRDDWNLLDSDVLRWTIDSGAPGAFFSDLLELRRAVEPAAAALAALHRTDADLAALDAALSAMAAAEQTPVTADPVMTDSDPVLAVRADASFHTALLTASGNPFFAQMRRVIIPALVVRDRHVHAGRHEHPLPAHALVADRVRARDQDGAFAAMLDVIELSRRGHP
ncbi:FadR/GntR family transcriptional regulator [Streptomyces sp. NBC_01361]|uniref:FadR/GntR family transcriptional regulator n=1 Tax=Streptomyces sp. NBC_01361 TaxID=2903838 RepID=UPI002E2F2098|nr:FCD domain-containing protein [Streptomyces sp. NBC_01361]